jgi:hypothetical protein
LNGFRFLTFKIPVLIFTFFQLFSLLAPFFQQFKNQRYMVAHQKRLHNIEPERKTKSSGRPRKNVPKAVVTPDDDEDEVEEEAVYPPLPQQQQQQQQPPQQLQQPAKTGWYSIL